MKLEINTHERKIRVLENANLGELFAFLEEILPDLKWREYSIEGNTVIKWQKSPVVTFTPASIPKFYPATHKNPYEIIFNIT